MRRGIYRLVEDVRRVAEHGDALCELTDKATDCRVSANVGDLMAAALAAAGSYAPRLGGRTACETDYLAASGATFPEDVPESALVLFNKQTLVEDMDEAAEHRRYAAIARFFRKEVA